MRGGCWDGPSLGEGGFGAGGDGFGGAFPSHSWLGPAVRLRREGGPGAGREGGLLRHGGGGGVPGACGERADAAGLGAGARAGPGGEERRGLGRGTGAVDPPPTPGLGTGALDPHTQG